MKTILEILTEEIAKALETFKNGTIPSPIAVDDVRRIEFDEETADDEIIGMKCLRNNLGVGLQIHEFIADMPYSYTDDEDEKEGGFIVWKNDTPHTLAVQICADFKLD